jgi:2-methylcitrate dehydratase
MDKVTSQIAAFSSALTFADLSAEVALAATERLVDSFGCAVAAHACAPAQIGMTLARGQVPEKYIGRILCHGHLASAELAAFVNTTMIRNLDFNDRFPGGHPSDCLGSLLGLAGAEPTSGAKLVTAMVVIYEIFARMSDAALLSRKGWDQGYVVGLSTAAGVCNFLSLSEEATAQALGIAASSNLPLRVSRSGELTQWKNVATAYAVRNGVFAALLAAEGMQGPRDAFAGRNGLWENVTGPFELAPFLNEGGAPLTPRVQLKFWPVETNAQPVVWAALELKGRISAEAIESIEVLTNKFTWFEIGSEPPKWDPQTRETADHSLPYILARTLVSGPLTEEAFSDKSVRDPLLRPLMSKIKVTVDPEIERLPLGQVRMKLIASLKDGSRLIVEVANPLGHPDNPMHESEINEKFLRLTSPELGQAKSKAALNAAWRIAEAANVGTVLELLDV